MAEVFRDALGIPHIRAEDVGDLAEAQGEVTARDRGWQIEVARLRATGRLSELTGPSGVPWDVFARRARLDDTARRAFAGLDPASAEFVRRYAAGVRRGMAATGGSAVEFRRLDEAFADSRPLEPWHDHDPLGVLHAAHALFSPLPLLLWREHVATTLGDEWVEVLPGFGDPGEDAVPASGSNGWALHGSRTESGMPLLAGDPHRTLELPGVYQQVRLACDEFDVVGLTFPGVPGVQHFGHTGHAAWGVTNAMAHTADVFRERLRRSAEGYEALGPDGWRSAAVVRSRLRVRGGQAIEVESIETERGTIVSDLSERDGELVGWSIRLPARAGGDVGASALLGLLRARTAEDVMAAFSSWVDPVNRVLAADRAGTVLSATVGATPDRPRAERRRARDGSTDAVAAKRPSTPAVRVTDSAVDANERPARSEIDLGWAYPPPHRASRVRQLLGERRPRTVGDFTAVWGDTAGGSLLPALLAAVRPAELSPHASSALEVLRAWDGTMDASSADAGRYAAWRAGVARRVASHPSLAPLRAPHPFGGVFDAWIDLDAQVPAALPRLLGHPALAHDIPGIVTEAWEEASVAPVWGELHRLLPAHALAPVPGVTAPGSDLDVPLSGDGETVRCTGSTPGVTHRGWRGSVARWAWDLADREKSLWGVPFGSAGDPSSAHFADQLGDWVAARPVPVTTDWTRLRADDPAGASGSAAAGSTHAD